MRKFKMPSAFFILFMIIVLVAILTWVVPAGTYQYVDDTASTLEPIPGTYSRADEQNPQGLWEILRAPVQGFFDAVDIILFILVIGGFLNVVTSTGAIDTGIGSIVNRFKGSETVMIPILMLAFGLGGTVFGMWEETIAFYILVIPVFIAAGFDALTGFAVIAIGAGIGCLGSTVNPFATGIASGFAGISIGEGIALRLVILVLGLAIGIIYVVRYAKRVKDDPSRSFVYHLKEENEKYFLKVQRYEAADKNSDDDVESSTAVGEVKLSGKQKAILAVFALSFLIMVLGVIPWAEKFGIYVFENFNGWLTNLPVAGTVLGNIVPLGEWWFPDITILFLFASILCAVIWRYPEIKFVALFLEGAKDLLSVALIIGITRGIAVIMNEGGMTATILNFGEQSLRNLGPVTFIVLVYLFFILLSFLIPSTSGLAALAMPVMAPIADFAGVDRALVITAFAAASGIVNLITPTSGVLMGTLAIARVSYGRYIKWVYKLVIILFVLVIALLAAAALTS